MQVWTEDVLVNPLRELHMAWELQAAQSMCLFCGFIPIEGMKGYLRIHGEDALCVRCDNPLPSAVVLDA